MKIYAQELKDGIADELLKHNSIAYTADIVSFNVSAPNIDFSKLIEKDNLALASSNPDQIDLFYLEAVLVSTGWNKNDDVFVPEELWAARKTPEDKQFNYMHDESDIIGHITSNKLSDFNNNILIEEDLHGIVPREFNIITNAVIYTNWSDPQKKERIERIIAEIKSGNKWYVSMECLFPNFDYALQNASGEINIIEREESSAFLTKYLRSYGGPGKYEEYKVGRVLRNLVFSGKGLVDQPANPRSIIFRQKEESIANIQENDMSDDKNQEFTVALQSELVDVKAELKNALAKINELNEVADSVASFKEQVTTLTSEKNSAEALLSDSKAEVEKLVAQIKDLETKNQELNETVADLNNTIQTQARKSQLVEAGLSGDKLDETLAKFSAVSDEQFESIVSLIAEAAKKSKEEDDMKNKSKPSEDNKEESYSSELDDVESDDDSATASVTETDTEDNKESLRSTASKWFEKTLASTRDAK